MQYRRLTKEELESMVEEFAIFLAGNSIDKKEWDTIKENDLDKAEDMLDIFSDMIFQKALTSCKYLERITETEIHVYYFQDVQSHLITVRIAKDVKMNFLEGKLSEIFIYLLKNKQLDVFHGTKRHQETREEEMFKIISAGATMSKGSLYNSLLSIL